MVNLDYFLSTIKLSTIKSKPLVPHLTRTASLILFALMFTPSSFAATTSNVIEDMNILVAQRRYQEAYDLGQANLFTYEGETEFDFLLGLSALEVGHPDEAVFAFERVAFNYSDQQRVKLELARAYFMSNNMAAADQLFREVLATEPEPNVTNNIQAFLEVIEQRQNSFDSTIDWYVTSSLGYDSNINSATELGIIDTPIGDIILNPGAQSMEDDFIDLGGGVTYTHPIDKNRAISISGNLNRHNNFSSDQFDLDVASADLSYMVRRGEYRINTSVRSQRVYLDREGFQNSNSILSTVQHFGNNGWSQSLTGAITGIRYDTSSSPNNNLRDINQVLVSGMLGKSSENFIHNLTVYYGDDHIMRDEGKNNATRFLGISFSEQYLFRPGHVPYFRLSLHKSDNKARDPIFNTERADQTFGASLGWIWQAGRKINITADVTYTDNESNLDLYSYDKLKYQAVLRYQF